MINSSISFKLIKWFFKILGFLCQNLYAQANFVNLNLFELNCTALGHASCHLICSCIIQFLFYIFFLVLSCNLPLVFFFFFSCFCSFALCFCLYPSTMPRKTRAHRTPSTSSESPSRSEVFRNDKSREAFETLNCKRKIWAERAVILDELNPAIRANFESRGWLPLLEIDHPPSTALIREFFSNLSCHVYDSNTLVRSWI